MSGSSWRIGEGELRGGDLCAGSGVNLAEMEKMKAAANVWGAEEAFLSPPEYGGSVTTLESEESSEDCEDYISGLAEEIAQSMLEEDEETSIKSLPWGIGVSKPAWSGNQMATSPSSPQSILAGMGGYNWDARSPGGNMGSSGVSSPPTPQEIDAVDPLYVERLRVKLEDQVKLASEQQVLSLQQQIIQRPTPQTACNALPSDNQSPLDNLSTKSSKNPRIKEGVQSLDNRYFRSGSKQVGAVWGGGPFAQQSNGGKGIISNKRRDEGVQQYYQFSLFASNMESNSHNSNRSLMVGNSNGKQEEGGMRAVFLGSTTSRECGGTGVFLPRRPQDSKRKPACSTVLLPSRIVHALNLKIEDTLPPPSGRDYPSSNSQWRRNSQVMSRRSRAKDERSSCYFPTAHPTTLQEVAPDISLPSEWTY